MKTSRSKSTEKVYSRTFVLKEFHEILSKGFAGGLTETKNWLSIRESDIWNTPIIKGINSTNSFGQDGSSNAHFLPVYICGFKTWNLDSFPYPSQPTSAFVFHSLAQFPVHEIFVPSPLSQRKGWCLPRGQLNTHPRAFRERAHCPLQIRTGGSSQPPALDFWVDIQRILGYSQWMAHSTGTVLFCLWPALPASWHMLSPRFPHFCPSLFSPFLMFLPIWLIFPHAQSS